MTIPNPVPQENTPVDDVRRVRERLDREAHGNVHELAERSRAAAERYREALNLHLVPAPKSTIDLPAKTA